MLPVLSASLSGEQRVRDLVERLAVEIGLTSEESAQLIPSGGQTVFANRVHWAKTYLAKAGLIENTRRGYFNITARGQQVLAKKPARIDTNFLSQFEEFENFRRRSSEDTASDQKAMLPEVASLSQTPDETMRSAHRQIDASLAQDLLERVRRAPPDFFERLIVNLLLSMGFGGSVADAGRALGRSGDDGVDGVIAKTRSALIASMFKRSATRSATTSVRAPFAISLAVLIVTKPPKAFS